MRQIVLDTETTGLDPAQGHRIIEIGCVELIKRRPTGRHFHHYLQPDRAIDPGAVEVHGITNEFLADKPRFSDISQAFLDFVSGAELVIHNAPFDVGFLDHELRRIESGHTPIGDLCPVVDTLVMARERHPGQRNSLDALCKRYGVDNTQRSLHGALLDAQILAEVYLAMTGGQVSMSLEADDEAPEVVAETVRRLRRDRAPLTVIAPSSEELAAHERYLQTLERASGGNCVWRALEADAGASSAADRAHTP